MKTKNLMNKKLFAILTITLLSISTFLITSPTSAMAIPITVTVDDATANHTTNYGVTFRTLTSGTVYGVELIFPDDFDVTAASLVGSVNIGHGELFKPSGEQTIVYVVSEPTVIPEGRIIALELGNIKNIAAEGEYNLTVTTVSYFDIIDGPYQSENFTINPELTVNPPEGPIQTQVTLTGMYFGANQAVDITLDNALTIASVTTNSTGGFTTTYTMDTIDYEFMFNATDADGYSAQTYFWMDTPEVYVEPYRGVPGNVLNVTGDYFSANADVDITWEIGQPNETHLNNTTTDENGHFEATFTLPNQDPGWYEVTAVDENSYEGSDDVFILEPVLQLDTDKAIVGSTVQAISTGFSANSSIDFIWDKDGPTETTLASGTTTALGAFNVTFTVPNVALGDYNVTAIDANLKQDFAEISIENTVVRLNSTYAIVGSTVQVTGEGFAASSSVALTWNETTLSTVQTSSDGIFNTTFTVPHAIGGIYVINATDAENNTAIALLILEPSVTTNVTEGAAGTAVTATGTGWAASQPFSLHLSPGELGPKVTNSTTNSTGDFTVTFIVPALDSYVYYVDVSYDGLDFENYDYARFWLLPGITLTPRQWIRNKHSRHKLHRKHNHYDQI